MADGRGRRAHTLIPAALGLVVLACGWLEIDSTVLDHLARVEGGREPDGWDLAFHVGGDQLAYRLSQSESFTESPSGPRLTIPTARIQGMRSVPIEIRYRNVFGLTRHTWVRFDVAKGLSGQVRAYLHEGQGWAALEAATDGQPARVRFNQRSGECPTVRYSVDSDSLDRTLERGEESIVLPGRPSAVAVRIDLCDGTTTEVQHAYPDGEYR